MYLGDFKQLKNSPLLVSKVGRKLKIKIRIEISTLETHYADNSGQKMVLQNPTYISLGFKDYFFYF